MPSLVLCYAPEDDAIARRLGGFLEANLAYDVSYGECLVRAGFDLIDAVERALSADVALVLLSPNSVPKVWKREKWEPVFFQNPAELGTLLGFVSLQECRFPELLRKRPFFDAARDFDGEARRIRRWILRPEKPLRQDSSLDAAGLDLRAKTGDFPGLASDVEYAGAMAFAAACEMDFEAVHRIDCRGRSRAGIVGDIGHAVPLRLAGTVAENRAALVEWGRHHRCLFVFANVAVEDRDFLTFGGLVSVIFPSNCPVRERAATEQIGGAFLAVPRDPDLCAALAGDAFVCDTGLLDTDFEAGLRLGWAVVSYLRAAERFAEVVEVLERMETAARTREDALALYRIGWEQSWLRETSAQGGTVCILPTAGEQVTQLSLF